MPTRNGSSLIETLVVIAILGLLLGLLFPALQSARQRAVELECKNNLYQINLAVVQFVEMQKRLPGPGSHGLVGGWNIDLLPFLDQKNLHDRTVTGNPIATAPNILLRQPGILRCPIRSSRDELAANTMDQAHYVFIPLDRKKSFRVSDAPLELKVPWASGPEMNGIDLIRQTGPHNGGFFYVGGLHDSVGFMSR